MQLRSSQTSLRFVLSLSLAAAGFTISIAPLRAESGDKGREDNAVELSFNTVGDSRQDPVAPDPTTLPLSGQDAIWLQNTSAWSRIIRATEYQQPDFLFFNGDMIMGYGNTTVPADTTTVPAIVNSDLVKTYQQYAFWRGMVAGLMESGTYVIPVAGNHEVQCKACGKKALAVNEDAWRANMGDLILDHPRFDSLFGEQPSFEDLADHKDFDALATDQTQLSYSFDFRGTHFVIINTDPTGNDMHAPINWLESDLEAAQGRGAKHCFVFGHKPAFTYYYGADPAIPLPAKPSGLDNDLVSRDLFWDLIEKFGATYFCGHEHIFHLSQPRAATGGKAWQILVGSGGSPFEALPTDATIHPSTDRKYAWVNVRVRRSGRVSIVAYGFDAGQNLSILQTVNLPR